MEESEREIIRRNFMCLLEATDCNRHFLAYFHENEILATADIEEIECMYTPAEKTSQFYRTIQTRIGSYSVLLKALQETGQSRALHILGQYKLDEKELQEQSEGGDTSVLSTKVQQKYNLQFQVLPPIGNFTGRKKELQQLYNCLFRTDNLVFISGLGGIGKTQLVRQFFKENVKEFNGSIWMNAKSEDKLLKGFFHLSQFLQISLLDPTGKRVYSKELVPAVYATLKTSKVLIVFDNVEDISWLNDYFPKNDEQDEFRFKTVVISRKRCKIEQGRSLHVEGLSIEDSIQLITLELHLNDSLDLTRTLAHRLNGFPLAIQQAISYIKHQRSTSKDYSLQTYLQELDQTLIQMLSFKPNLSIENDYKQTTITTFKSTLDQIADTPKIGNFCTWIVNLSAYLCNYKISKDFFYNVQPNMEVFNLQLNSGMRLISKTCSPFYKNCHSEIVTRKNVELALDILYYNSIINFNKDKRTFNVNTLVQELIRIPLKSMNAEVGVLSELVGILRNEREHKESLEHINHCENVWSHALNYSELLKEHSIHIVEVICHLEKLKGVSKALSFGRNASNNIKDQFGEDHKDYFKIKTVLASVLANDGNNTEALQEITSLIELYTSKYESDDMRLLTLEGYQASILRKMGRFEEASNIFLKIYEKKRNCLGYTHVGTIKAQENYAVSLVDCGYLDKALSIHLKSCKILTEQLGQNHISVIQARNNLGYVYFKKGDHQKALKIFEDVYPKIVQNLDKDVTLFKNICLNYIQVLNALEFHSTEKKICYDSYDKVKSKLGEFHKITRELWRQIHKFRNSTVNFTNLASGERTKSKYERYGDKICSLLQEMRRTGDFRIHSHQIEAVLRTKQMLIEDSRRKMKEGEKINNNLRPVLIVSPPDSGQSGMIFLLPYVLKARKVLILTPSKIMSKQLGKVFGLELSDKNFFQKTQVLSKDEVEMLEPVKMIKKLPDIYDNLTNCVIVNAQRFKIKSNTTLNLIYKNQSIIKDVNNFFAQFDLLIVDNANLYPAKTWKLIVDTFSIQATEFEKTIVFLTATPYQMGPKGEQLPILADLDSRIACKITVDDLEGRYIRQVSFMEGENLAQLSVDIQTILNNQFLQEPRFQPQAMITVKDKKEAEKYEEVLNKANGPNYAVAIFRGRADIDEEQLKRDFDNGLHRVAIVCGLSSAGYDNPKVTLCVILRKIASQMFFSQFVGRCMRINRSIGEGHIDKTRAVVLSYTNFEQRKMWDEREQLAESDPVEYDEDNSTFDF